MLAWVLLDEVVVSDCELIDLITIVGAESFAVNGWKDSGDFAGKRGDPVDEHERASHESENDDPGEERPPKDLSPCPVSVLPDDVGRL